MRRGQRGLWAEGRVPVQHSRPPRVPAGGRTAGGRLHCVSERAALQVVEARGGGGAAEGCGRRGREPAGGHPAAQGGAPRHGEPWGPQQPQMPRGHGEERASCGCRQRPSSPWPPPGGSPCRPRASVCPHSLMLGAAVLLRELFRGLHPPQRGLRSSRAPWLVPDGPVAPLPPVPLPGWPRADEGQGC